MNPTCRRIANGPASDVDEPLVASLKCGNVALSC